MVVEGRGAREEERGRGRSFLMLLIYWAKRGRTPKPATLKQSSWAFLREYIGNKMTSRKLLIVTRTTWPLFPQIFPIEKK